MADFEKRLATFIKSTKTAMSAARDCANMAITHFEKTGDLTYCQRFLEAMPQNYMRKAAYLKWLAAHAPVMMEGGQLKKDKGDKAVEFNLEAAIATPFWDYAPEAPVVNFTSDDVVGEVLKLIKRYEGDKRNPADAEATKVVTDLKGWAANRKVA